MSVNSINRQIFDFKKGKKEKERLHCMMVTSDRPVWPQNLLKNSEKNKIKISLLQGQVLLLLLALVVG